ncbi:MAG: hypothetical protein ACPGJI_08150 [Kangiellaceae bacterium]
MKEEEVPQDQSPTYEGQKKLIYAVDKDGHYRGVKSTGWEVESFATEMAVNDLKAQAEEAFQQAKQKKVSPLAYHMAVLRFDLISLAQCTGFFQWQIKRHLKPNIFKRLSKKKLQSYSDVMKISVENLKKLPEIHTAAILQDADESLVK